jgi:tRNA nucleotidyltransferase (CCA-adding enzyme)
MDTDVQVFALPDASPVLALARAFASAGGRVLIVGGWVRDRVLGRGPQDVDLEVHGLAAAAVMEILESFGRVKRVGHAFAVFRVRGLALQIGLPPATTAASRFDIAGALRRRDLTVNSMAWDPLSGELFDPFDGRRDLRFGMLRATDRETFGSDALRALRVAQFVARFSMRPDAELVELCAACDLSVIPGERLLEEFRKLLLLGERPAAGLQLLKRADLLRFFPELGALVDVPQDPHWHEEGDVWSHTLLAVDAAARLRGGDGGFEDQALMFGVLCHDLGKPGVTEELAGRVVSRGHEEVGVELSERLLGRLRAPTALTRVVTVLVRHHLVPASFVTQGAGPRAYRRLARELARGGVSFELLERVARADQLGRFAGRAPADGFPEGQLFLERAHEYLDGAAPRSDVVKGRHLIARGFEPGPELGRILDRCREVQDETGWSQPDRILNRVIAEPASDA